MVSRRMLLADTYLDEWKAFLAEHEGEFQTSDTDAKSSEYSLSATAVHCAFVEMVEQHLDDALRGAGITSEAFLKGCSDMQSREDRDGSVDAFLQLILGATDFGVFGDIMRDGGKRAYYFQILGMWRKTALRDRSEAK